MIVTEMLHGDLESLLRDKKVPLSPITKVKMARDAALGMNWYFISTTRILTIEQATLF
jgi:hypothetical protein